MQPTLLTRPYTKDSRDLFPVLVCLNWDKFTDLSQFLIVNNLTEFNGILEEDSFYSFQPKTKGEQRTSTQVNYACATTIQTDNLITNSLKVNSEGSSFNKWTEKVLFIHEVYSMSKIR